MSDDTPAYELEDVTFAYGAAPVLRVPRLAIARGQVTALAGANGSGKTTLLHLLGFLAAPHSGRLIFQGEQVTPKNRRASRRRVGLLLQHPYLFHTTVLANVARGLRLRGLRAREARQRARAALERVGLKGLEARPAAELSGGEAKRVALARVLAFETDVLLLDEPLTHMDRHSAQQTEQLILHLNRDEGRTIVLTSHNLLWAQALADRVLSFHQGNLVPASLANVFRGTIRPDGTHFDTGRIAVYLGEREAQGGHLAIDPEAIVLSRQPLASSMRNTFRGRIVAISEHAGNVRVDVDAGERFHVEITRASLDLLDLRLGEELLVCFKSAAVKVF